MVYTLLQLGIIIPPNVMHAAKNITSKTIIKGVGRGGSDGSEAEFLKIKHHIKSCSPGALQ